RGCTLDNPPPRAGLLSDAVGNIRNDVEYCDPVGSCPQSGSNRHSASFFSPPPALVSESYSVHDLHERLAHGRQLKIFLAKGAEKLEFTPAYEPSKTFLYWERDIIRMTRGRVSGTGSDRRWYIDQVTYEDQGTYTQKAFWNNEISVVKVAVTPRHNYVKCVAGESLYISLEGIDLADAVLSFSGETNVTLVRDGTRVSQDLPDYWDRVQTHSKNIEIKNVNYTDQGRYTLKDRRDRLVSITRMDLTDHHDSENGNPLLALLLLLGIPAGICCCCRKKIFKKKAPAAAMLQTNPQVVNSPAGPPPYYSPGQPGLGFNPAYPQQNPAYPPAGPAMMAPAQPPQWNGPPPGQYPPVAPMGYAPAPVMYSSPPPVTEEVKMENMASSPADPLLNATPQLKEGFSAALHRLHMWCHVEKTEKTTDNI
ncbi:hypothetical protein L3Q82_019263, partial [Scortum barcoo]